MVESAEPVVRPFDTRLHDAAALLAVERATFDESPYTAEEVQAMLLGGPQRAWLAVLPSAGGEGETVAGFVVAFPTAGLRGLCWEIDLLAVHPAWRGRGLARRLIRAAVTGGVGVARRARAVSATDNRASCQAFVRAGFVRQKEVCSLLIYRTGGGGARPWHTPGVAVRETADQAEARAWLGGAGFDLPPLASDAADPPPVPTDSRLTLLLAEQAGRPAGYAELLQVQTLLYSGLWIESLTAPRRSVRQALIAQAVSRANTAGLDEVGAMVPQRNGPLQHSLLSSGFRSLGQFCWLTAELPLPADLPANPAWRAEER